MGVLEPVPYMGVWEPYMGVRLWAEVIPLCLFAPLQTSGRVKNRHQQRPYSQGEGAEEHPHGGQPLSVHRDGLTGGVQLHPGRGLSGVLHHADVTWDRRENASAEV